MPELFFYPRAHLCTHLATSRVLKNLIGESCQFRPVVPGADGVRYFLERLRLSDTCSRKSEHVP